MATNSVVIINPGNQIVVAMWRQEFVELYNILVQARYAGIPIGPGLIQKLKAAAYSNFELSTESDTIRMIRLLEEIEANLPQSEHL